MAFAAGMNGDESGLGEERGEHVGQQVQKGGGGIIAIAPVKGTNEGIGLARKTLGERGARREGMIAIASVKGTNKGIGLARRTLGERGTRNAKEGNNCDCIRR